MQLKLAEYSTKNKYYKDGQSYSVNFLENEFSGGYSITITRDDTGKIIYHSIAGNSKERDLDLFEEFIKANDFKWVVEPSVSQKNVTLEKIPEVIKRLGGMFFYVQQSVVNETFEVIKVEPYSLNELK